jgi:photosystem II stability/assembly factor-like uncharacterized protein
MKIHNLLAACFFYTLPIKLRLCVFGRYLFTAFLFCTLTVSIAQEVPVPTISAERLEGYQQRKSLKENSMFSALPFSSIGPSIFSGRIVDVDVNPVRPTEMYVAYASGGLWYTDNNGTSFSPIFDQQACMTIGDIAVNWTTNIIWVGTGENNSSRSSYSGVGIYKSMDKGKTWKHMGLPESHHIGRILLHPVNPNIVHVACLGALYSDNPNRGVYSTSDGGVTWRQALTVNAKTGAIDLVSDPSNPNVIYASTWERNRSAWNFTESGPGSGIYKSIDAGRTWQFLTDAQSGFPHGIGTGRIGLDIVRMKNEIILYAVVDNQFIRPAKEPENDVLTKAELSGMSVDSFLALKNEILKAFLEDNVFPEKYSADTIKTLVKKGTIKPVTLVEYLQDANSQLFDTEVIGTEIYSSRDGGKTWTKTHEGFLNNIFYTYGYYFGQIRASKANPQKLYILGVPILKSEDAGVTWKSIEGDNAHGDHHALWLNPKQDGHLVLGNDGGLNISYDDGVHWVKCNQPAVGQYYSVAVDMDKPYNVYGGLQDNGVWVGPSNNEENVSWHSTGRYPFKSIMGGDGMQVAVDTRDNNTVYTGYQFGNYYKVTRNDEVRDERITPVHEFGQRPYRWNWETPIHLSVHNQDILYIGAERVFRSFDKGKNFKAISGDLTHGGKEGDVAYGTIVSLHESPLAFGLIYAGSDDGYIQSTHDGGNNWKRISEALPQNLWVSSIQASSHSEGRVYITLNGYRWDHFESYVYASEDYGNSWQRIAVDLPAEPVNVIKEDPVNQDILYIGTDHALYITLDRGNHCMMMGDMPAAPVHDLAIQSRDKEIVVATHGRSLYTADIRHVQQIKQEMSEPLTCFDEKLSIYHRDNWGKRSAEWVDYYEPSVSIPVYTTMADTARLMIYEDSVLVSMQDLALRKGLSYYPYHLEINEMYIEPLKGLLQKKDPESKPMLSSSENGKYYLPPGKYKIMIRLGENETSCSLEVKTRK